ncbi:MAG: PD40 domain-containing protein [Saprospirales bacterium]|nr:PD40 domain-containing protein [Saprospirales bacterium]
MNTTIRASWMPAILLCLATGLFSQTSAVKENLSRADKQFDLYAYNLALRTYEQVIKEQPNNAHALARIGDCHFQLNRPQEALSWYDQAVLRPEASPETMLNYGKALMHTGDYIGAKKWFVMYAEGNPSIGQHYAQMCDYALQASRKEGFFQALNEPLNTEASDYGPAFYGSKLVYNSARTDLKRSTAKANADWSGSAYNQLFVTQRNPGDNYLQRPAFLRGDLQSNYNEGPVSFSTDGRRVAFCRNNFIDGTRQIASKGLTMSLYLADVVDGNWMNERPFAYNGSDYATGFPGLSPDGNTLYFASNQAGGYGGWDIYVSNYIGGNWSIPRNLGAVINTAGNEVTPFYDGANLYFSSDWHKGLGGMDVFRADGQENAFTNVVQMGSGVNSSRDDYGFIFDTKSNTGYLTSNRPEGRGNEDIWQVRKRVDEFVITVTDPQRNPIAGAEIDFSACNAGMKQTDATGRYSFAIASGKADCQVTVRKMGYRSAVLPVKSAGDKILTAVLLPEYGTTTPSSVAAQPYNNDLSRDWQGTAPVTYNTTPDYPVENGSLDKFTVYVNDDQGRPLSAAELNLSTCGLGTVYTDISGKGSFYFPHGATCNLVIRKSGLEDVVVPIHAQTSREMSIAMSSDPRTKFSGLVLDAYSRRGIQGVMVTARSRQGNHETLASSNAAGQYTLLLRPYQVYDISYVRDDYLTFNTSLQTERALRADMDLSPIALESNRSLSQSSTAPATYYNAPSGNGIITLSELNQQTGATQPAVLQDATSAKTTGYAVQLSANPEKFTSEKIRKYEGLLDLGTLYVVQDGKMHKLRLGVYPTREAANAALAQVTPTIKDAFVVWETQAEQNLLVNGDATDTRLAAKSPVIRYAVQVASWPSNRPVILGDYANLNGLGHVYMQPENDRLRVRVGTWDSYDKAETARAEAVRLGYRDAIIVPEKINDSSGGVQAPATSSPKGISVVTPSQYSTTSGVAPVQAAGLRYYIRVCALDDAYNFDAKKVDGSGGVIEKWPIGDTQRIAIMLTGLTSLEHAMTATDRLRARGFADAYIIKDENGKMSKYRY